MGVKIAPKWLSNRIIRAAACKNRCPEASWSALGDLSGLGSRSWEPGIEPQSMDPAPRESPRGPEPPMEIRGLHSGRAPGSLPICIPAGGCTILNHLASLPQSHHPQPHQRFTTTSPQCTTQTHHSFKTMPLQTTAPPRSQHLSACCLPAVENAECFESLLLWLMSHRIN